MDYPIKKKTFNCKVQPGESYGKLITLHRFPLEFDTPVWVCQCKCGRTTVFAEGKLRSGEAYSCGCDKHRTLSAEERKKMREAKKRHIMPSAEGVVPNEMSA